MTHLKSYLMDAAISGSGITTIWGLSLSEWDQVTKIAATIAVTAVTITLSIIRHKRKK